VAVASEPLPRGEAAHHEQPEGLAHHFDTFEQQRQSASFGMWLFLATEFLFFGTLFMAYTLYRTLYPAAFRAASRTLDVKLGTINTAVLICSSLTMALAVREAQKGKRKSVAAFLFGTIVLGSAFLGIKAIEYKNKFVEHHVPGPTFHFEGTDPVHAQMFFNLYFMMTGLHALHMIIGMGLLCWLIALSLRGKFTAENHDFVEGFGLYWHFVDIVWIFLFPLLYLVGRHGV